MPIGDLKQLWNVGGSGRKLAVQRGKERNRVAAGTCDFQHFPAALSELKRVNDAAGDIYERTNTTHDGLSAAGEVHLTPSDVERLIPAVAMGGRARALRAGLYRESLALRFRGRDENRHVNPNDAERSLSLARRHDNRLLGHGATV